MLRSAFVFILIFSFSAITYGQAIMQTQLDQRKSSWSGFANLGYSSNLQDRNAYEHQSLTTMSLLTNYRLSKGNIIRGSLSGYQEHSRGQETKLNDGNLGWVNNGFWHQGKAFSLGQQLRAVLPSSKESRVRDEKLVGVSLIPILVASMAPIGLPSVTFIYLPQFTKNFNKYEQNRAYQNNVEYSVSNIGILSWSMTDKLYLESSLVYGQSWSYGGVKRNDTFNVGSELGYNLNSSLTLSVGFTNGGAITNPEQGNDQTIEFYNNRTASVYTGLNYAF